MNNLNLKQLETFVTVQKRKLYEGGKCSLYGAVYSQ